MPSTPLAQNPTFHPFGDSFMQANRVRSNSALLNEHTNTLVPLQARPWLDTESTSSRLLIWDTERTRISAAEVLDLDVVLPDGTSLLDPINADWLQLVTSYVYLLRDDRSLSLDTAKTHISVVDRLLIFLKWARLHGIFDLGRMTPDLIEKFSSDISLGTGHALKYVDRLKRYLREAKGDLPFVTDKLYPKRKTLDVAAICQAIFITFHGLSSDKAASQLLARVSARRGYRPPSWQAPTKGPLPAPKPVTRATHSRFVEAIRYLHKWNRELNDAGLRFVPLPTKADKPGSSRLRPAGHTKNIPPAEAMALLDTSLAWIYQHGPRVLDLFDDVEAFHEAECLRAGSLDRWKSDLAVQELRRAMSRFLAAEDSRGIVPHGCIKVIRNETGKGYTIARAILAGKFTTRSRTAASAWLSPATPVDDTRLAILLRGRLSKEQHWATTWPYSMVQLAEMTGTGIGTMKRFIDGGWLDVRSLERIEGFLISQGAMSPIEAKTDGRRAPDRMDHGIAANLAKYVAQHPLNTPVESGGPWPLRWNLTNSSRDSGLSLFEALRYCIPAAARIVIGVFQARRESELTSLATDCISLEEGNLWFESHIAKSLRRDKKLPTVKTTADAVAVLDRWSARGREMNGTNLLFSHWEPLGDAISVVKPNQDLNRFAALALKNPLSAPLQVRQFRRFFAVTFMWRYRLGSLPALSGFLCHSGLSMTWEYVTEKVGTTVMREAQAEFSKEMLVGAALGRIKLHGSFGRTWHRWAEKIRAQVKATIEFVNSPQEADRIFLQHVEAGIRMLTPTPGGVCSAGDRERDNKRAMCGVPDPEVPGRHVKKPELARPAQCACCPFNATDEKHRTHWASIAAEARAAADSEVPSIIRDRARLDAPKLERIVTFFSTD
ncbi:hypothetical protein [Roseateles koreensis]|uniref:Phage integrase family protein n=1 Tax=Roseateles koreensis TaxID=2987526 RepID=A0ABT5KST6_9BURK|nr:hypothetical protein [Roseateles koreensis]MDC8785998.1 hypothetical protein [Roseateles koreensis]